MNAINMSRIDAIQERCDSRSFFLKELIRGRFAFQSSYLSGDLTFGVARRWNSWYPSYFDVEGGCYVLIPGDMNPEYEHNKKDDRVGVIVVDPGYTFIDILRSTYQIEPQDIAAVIVTHFHPDHMAGLLEYATIMNTSKQPCNIYLNETMYNTFRSLQNAFITVHELLHGQIQEIMRYASVNKTYRRIIVKTVGVHHTEIGNQHRSIGLVLEITSASNWDFERNAVSIHRIGILGDTDGSQKYVPFYVDNFKEVDLLILHLGTFSNRKLGRGGKHLYINGVRDVLQQLGGQLMQNGNLPKGMTGYVVPQKKTVVLSEFGLELANDESLYRQLQPFIESFVWRLPLLFSRLYRSGEDEEPSAQKANEEAASRFFARATLGNLERVYTTDQGILEASQMALSRIEMDELIISHAFQVLCLGKHLPTSVISRLQDKLAAQLEKERRERLIDGWDVTRYLQIMDGELAHNPELLPLRQFMRDLVRRANFGRKPIQTEHLVSACKTLLTRVSRNLENKHSVLYFIDTVQYISRYAESLGISSVAVDSKTESDQNTTTRLDFRDDLGLLWTAGIVGLCILRDVLLCETIEPDPGDENALLDIGDYFRQYAVPWGNLLIGDIGCTFAFGPDSVAATSTRNDKIMIRSAEGRWISASEADYIYDDEDERITYRARLATDQPRND